MNVKTDILAKTRSHTHMQQENIPISYETAKTLKKPGTMPGL